MIKMCMSYQKAPLKNYDQADAITSTICLLDKRIYLSGGMCNIAEERWVLLEYAVESPHT